jgi:predicted nucleotidyltransferase
MKRLERTRLSPNQRQALEEIRRELTRAFDVAALVLFGSAARGEADEESDADLLVVTNKPLPRPVRHRITDMVFEINLRHGTNFSTLVVDRHSWEEGAISVTPLRTEILKEGIPL